MHSLPIFVRLNGRSVILLGDGDAATAKRTLLERAGAVIVGENARAALAIVAIDDEAEAVAAVDRLTARGVLVNAVDRPALCDFTLPAIIDRDPVIIAISSGGASAGLAKALRQRLETLLPSTIGGLASALGAARSAMRTRWADAVARRHAIDAALSEGGPLDPLTAIEPDAVPAWLGRGAEGAAPSGGIQTFEIASDDPDQLTIGQARLLGRADGIVHDSAIAPAILARGRADAVRWPFGKQPNPLPAGLILRLVRKGQS
jgi:uroporphyrin-III C-methyltransferase / precorrin-2 dehydrogenase / sirohydrochlorin ferrochelatase